MSDEIETLDNMLKSIRELRKSLDSLSSLNDAHAKEHANISEVLNNFDMAIGLMALRLEQLSDIINNIAGNKNGGMIH